MPFFYLSILHSNDCLKFISRVNSMNLLIKINFYFFMSIFSICGNGFTYNCEKVNYLKYCWRVYGHIYLRFLQMFEIFHFGGNWENCDRLNRATWCEGKFQPNRLTLHCFCNSKINQNSHQKSLNLKGKGFPTKLQSQ